MVKTDESGNASWIKTYGGDGQSASDIIQLDDDGYLICGDNCNTGGRSFDIMLVRTDFAGDSLWTTQLGSDSMELPNFICPTSDGNFLFVGKVVYFNGDFDPNLLVYSISATGDSLGSFVYGGQFEETVTDIVSVSDQAFVILGTQRLGPTDIDMWMVGFDGSTGVDDIAAMLPSALKIQSIYPNPFNLTANINFSINQPGEVSINAYNILGQSVFEDVYYCPNPGNFSYLWNPDGLGSGTYFIKIRSENDFISAKAVLLK